MLQSTRSVCVVKIVARQSPVVIIARVIAHSRRHAIPRKSSQNARQSHVPVERRGESLLQKLPLRTLLHKLGRLGGLVHLFVCDTHGKHAIPSSVAKPSRACVGAGESTTTSRDARAPPIAPPVRAAKNTRARAFYTYPSSSAPSSSSIVVVRRKRPSAPRAHPMSSSRARPETSRARAPHHRFIFDTHHIGVDVCRMRMTHQPWCA